MKDFKNEQGVTLVEMAIVMIIVGLLIAAMLKGQELIANSQVTSTMAQFEGIAGAIQTFQDNYGVYPGDMSNAEFRLAGCAGGACNNGNGDGIINHSVGVAGVPGNESGHFFAHLRAVELLSGYDGTNTARFGNAFPPAYIGGGFMVGDMRNGGSTGFTDAELGPAPYLILINQVVDVATNTGIVTVTQAARMDRGLDDGNPDEGVVVAQAGNNRDCRRAVDTYDEGGSGDCVIAYRLPDGS